MPGRFKIEVTNSTDAKYDVRLLVTPMQPGSDQADPNLRLERHMREHLAIEITRDILKRCPSVPEHIIKELSDLYEVIGSTH